MKRKFFVGILVLFIALSPLFALGYGKTMTAAAQGTGPIRVYIPLTMKSGAAAPSTVTCGNAGGNSALETFEGAANGWQVAIDTTANTGATVVQSTAQAGMGAGSALATTTNKSQQADVHAVINDDSSAHVWGEAPGTYNWQQACMYIPSSTINNLGSGQYMTIAGIYPNAGGAFGWWLRVKQGGQLYAVGYPYSYATGQPVEFQVYGQVPTDKWFELEIGLHSQAGPGIKRAFAFALNGNFYGWYNQGNMDSNVPDVFNRIAMGILDENVTSTLQVYIDQWRQPGTGTFPNGPDFRSIAPLQTQDFTKPSGIGWQIDWSTWANNLVLSPQYGFYSATNRLQGGHNIERMPVLTNGWAEIQYGWPLGTPPASPNAYFAAMIGFRKNLSMEENLEVIPYGDGKGGVNLVFEAWVGGAPIQMASWALPASAAAPGQHIPEPGDIIRVRWEQTTATNLHVQASFYDASASTWYPNAIDYNFNDTAVGTSAVNFTDGLHILSEMTIDTQYYSIMHETVGTLDTYVAP